MPYGVANGIEICVYVQYNDLNTEENLVILTIFDFAKISPDELARTVSKHL